MPAIRDHATFTEVEPLPGLRIVCPEWFERADFLAYLKAEGQLRPSFQPDAWLYVPADDHEPAGLPPDIWERLRWTVEQTYGLEAPCLVWIDSDTHNA